MSGDRENRARLHPQEARSLVREADPCREVKAAWQGSCAGDVPLLRCAREDQPMSAVAAGETSKDEGGAPSWQSEERCQSTMRRLDSGSGGW